MTDTETAPPPHTHTECACYSSLLKQGREEAGSVLLELVAISGFLERQRMFIQNLKKNKEQKKSGLWSTFTNYNRLFLIRRNCRTGEMALR